MVAAATRLATSKEKKEDTRLGNNPNKNIMNPVGHHHHPFHPTGIPIIVIVIASLERITRRIIQLPNLNSLGDVYLQFTIMPDSYESMTSIDIKFLLTSIFMVTASVPTFRRASYNCQWPGKSCDKLCAIPSQNSDFSRCRSV